MTSKRRRLALSCVDCRRRKVKCGRELPTCVRCIKAGNADNCQYVQYDDGSGNLLPTPTDDSPDEVRDANGTGDWAEQADSYYHSSRAATTNAKAAAAAAVNSRASVKRPAPVQPSVEQMQEKVSELEALVLNAGSQSLQAQRALGMDHPALRPHTRPALSSASRYKDSLQDFERSLLRGKSFKTQYFGPSHGASLLLQFEELSVFVRDILRRIPYFDKVKETLKAVRSQNDSIAPSHNPRGFEALAAMIPDKARVDELVNEYLNHFETTLRVLHVPTFQQRYAQFWTNANESSTEFVVMLLLVMAAVNCVVPGPRGFLGRSSVAREGAIRWIDASEAWLEQQSHKHTTLEYYQIQVLLLIAKRMTCYKCKREWSIAGHLLRLAMASGFHREPTHLTSRLSVFDREMRRRLWFTIAELDFQAACDRGMRASISREDWDVSLPLNVHDEDFSESTQSMPTTKPLSEFTRTSFLCKAAQHLPLRLEILNSINNLTKPLELEAAMLYDDHIRETLDSLPEWTDRAITKVPQALSKLMLHECLMLIHQPFATQSLVQARFFYSRCARRDSALTVLSIYSNLPESHRLALSNQRDDCFRAGLATCHDIAVGVGGREDLTHNRAISVDLVQKTVELMERRVTAVGQGFHSFWLSSSALGLVRAKLNPEVPSETFAQEAADRVVKLHDELLSLQQKGYAGHVFAMKLSERAQKVHGPEYHTSVSQPNGTPGMATQGSYFDDFTTMDPFNDSMFDFNMADIWLPPE